jgi:hypothetical protein
MTTVQLPTSHVTMTTVQAIKETPHQTMTATSSTTNTLSVNMMTLNSSHTSSADPSSHDRKQISLEHIQATVHSPWEKWLVKKAKEEYEKKKISKAARADRKKKDTELSKQAAAKKKLAKQHHCEWVQYSVEAERKQRRKEKREKEEQQRRNLKKQEEVQTKAEESFEHWKKEKEKQRKHKLKKQQIEEELKEKAESERKLKAKEVYEQWLEEVEIRYQKNGYVYREHTPPSFVNSQKWIGPCDDNVDDGSPRASKTSSLSNIEEGLLVCQITTPSKVISVRKRHRGTRKY